MIIENPLYLDVVFAVWKLDEDGNIIANYGEINENLLEKLSSSVFDNSGEK